jgi:hypothetical protein
MARENVVVLMKDSNQYVFTRKKQQIVLKEFRRHSFYFLNFGEGRGAPPPHNRYPCFNANKKAKIFGHTVTITRINFRLVSS